MLRPNYCLRLDEEWKGWENERSRQELTDRTIKDAEDMVKSLTNINVSTYPQTEVLNSALNSKANQMVASEPAIVIPK